VLTRELTSPRVPRPRHLKITLKIGKNTQDEIAALMIIVTKSASVSPVPPAAGDHSAWTSVNTHE
jgi:hypothetical protein